MRHNQAMVRETGEFEYHIVTNSAPFVTHTKCGKIVEGLSYVPTRFCDTTEWSGQNSDICKTCLEKVGLDKTDLLIPIEGEMITRSEYRTREAKETLPGDFGISRLLFKIFNRRKNETN